MTSAETGIVWRFSHWALNNFPEDKARELFITYPENAPSIIEANIANPVAVAGRV